MQSCALGEWRLHEALPDIQVVWIRLAIAAGQAALGIYSSSSPPQSSTCSDLLPAFLALLSTQKNMVKKASWPDLHLDWEWS